MARVKKTEQNIHFSLLKLINQPINMQTKVSESLMPCCQGKKVQEISKIRPDGKLTSTIRDNE